MRWKVFCCKRHDLFPPDSSYLLSRENAKGYSAFLFISSAAIVDKYIFSKHGAEYRQVPSNPDKILGSGYY
jgi:hypothetical protein